MPRRSESGALLIEESSARPLDTQTPPQTGDRTALAPFGGTAGKTNDTNDRVASVNVVITVLTNFFVVGADLV